MMSDDDLLAKLAEYRCLQSAAFTRDSEKAKSLRVEIDAAWKLLTPDQKNRMAKLSNERSAGDGVELRLGWYLYPKDE